MKKIEPRTQTNCEKAKDGSLHDRETWIMNE